MKRLLMIAGLMIAGFAVIQLGLAADVPERSSPQATTWEYRSVEGRELLGLSGLPLNKPYNLSVLYWKGLGVHAVGFNQWWVPTVEFTAGSAVVIGFLAPLAALGLLVIILVAIATSGRQRIKVYKPIDEADRIDDWLYLPEVLYAFMLIMVVSAGAGPYSLDALILGLIDKRGA